MTIIDVKKAVDNLEVVLNDYDLKKGQQQKATDVFQEAQKSLDDANADVAAATQKLSESVQAVIAAASAVGSV